MNTDLEISLNGNDEVQDGNLILACTEGRTEYIDGHPLLIDMPDDNAYYLLVELE